MTATPTQTPTPAGQKRTAAPAGGTPVSKVPPTAAPAAAPAAAGVEGGAAPVVKRGGGLVRHPFDARTAVKADGSPAFRVDDQGRALLTAFPANYELNKHKALEKTDFTQDQEGEASFYDYKAAQSEKMRDVYQKSAEEYRAQATNIRKYGNSAKRDLATKANKMIAEFTQMREQMIKEGVDTAELDSMIAKFQAAKQG